MTTTSKFPLRMTPAERDMIEATQKAAGEAGIMVSLNDVIRHMIRRAHVEIPRTEEEARAAIKRHWVDCDVCTADAMPRCLDGHEARRDYIRATWTVLPAPEAATT